MILVTGAGGKTGRAVVAALVARGVSVRAFVRREVHRETLLDVGAAEVQVGEFLDETAIVKAVQGMRAIYHIPPNVHPQEVAIALQILQAAQAAGVAQFVYHSVLHPQIEAMPHHWLKMRVEELIFTAGMDFAILQPCAYMQNILGFWAAMRDEGVYAVPYNVQARLSIVDLNDIAEVAALVLTETGHENAVYELAGPQALSQTEVATLASVALGRPVVAEQTPLGAWQAEARAVGLGAYAVDTLSKMFLYYEEHGLVGNSSVLAGLLGRAPKDFADFLKNQTE